MSQCADRGQRAAQQRRAARTVILILVLLTAVVPAVCFDPANAAPPGAGQPQGKLEKGKFLVSSRNLHDPTFSETVILLIAYGPNGAMGVIVNRPSEIKLAKVLPDIKQLRHRSDRLYIGGPVATHNVLLLVRAAKEPSDALSVFEDVYVSASMTFLRQQLERKEARQALRAYAGHAGWAPGQLDAEVERGDWHIMSGDVGAIFTGQPKDLWEKLIQHVEGDWVCAPSTKARA